MYNAGVSGLAVTDTQGRLVDVLSARDLRRMLLGDAFFSLFESVKAFKALIRVRLGAGSESRVPGQPVTVASSDNLFDVVNALNTNQVIALITLIILMFTESIYTLDALSNC